MKINEKIREYRITHGLLLKYVAESSGISMQRYSLMERGGLKMSVDDFVNICKKGLNVDPSIFYNNEV
jgi:Helix-turn-helix.